METIYDSPRISISRLAGDSGSAVVSFAGVGLALDGLPHEEFVKTLSGSRHDQFFVIDKSRSWYNDTASEILEQLSSRIEEFQQVYTVGNSMGGFGAIYFGPTSSKVQDSDRLWPPVFCSSANRAERDEVAELAQRDQGMDDSPCLVG